MDKYSMDASKNEEEKTTVDDGNEPTTEDFGTEENRKFDGEEENNEGKSLEIGGASEQRMTKEETLDNNVPRGEDEKEETLDNDAARGEDEREETLDNDVARGEDEKEETLDNDVARGEDEKESFSTLSESEVARLNRPTSSEDEASCFEMDPLRERCIMVEERHDRKQMKKEKQQRLGKANKQKKAEAKLEARRLALRNQDDQLCEERTSSNVSRFQSSVLNTEESDPTEMEDSMENKSKDERRDKSDVIISGRSLKEYWDDSSDDESGSAESLKKGPEELEQEKSDTTKKKKVEIKGGKLRSPVICVLGHVDTGKTKLLDFIRRTYVQDAEVRGIAQQIGATLIPQEALLEMCKMAKDCSTFDLKLPGLLMIDTPGHELFKNLRSRCASMCDMAILVVDILRGLEKQTIESINLLRESKKPFIVALNKVDRLYGWESSEDSDVENTVQSQGLITQMQLEMRCREVIEQFANKYIDAALFYKNKDPRTSVSVVPTSAIYGDGIGNLMSLITRLAQALMHKKLVFSEELKATVLEVKSIRGKGTTIDVLLVSGKLNEGDTIVMAGWKAPFVSQIRQIRSLFTPHPLKEHAPIEGAQWVRITGKDLAKAVAGLSLFVARNPHEVKLLKEKAAALIEQVKRSIKTSDRGVCVHAFSLTSLQDFLEHLASNGIPYSAVKIGPVVKNDVVKASGMLESDVQYASILALDVKVEKKAQEHANEVGVKVFPVNFIYDARIEFLKHREECLRKQAEALSEAVFPCSCIASTAGRTSFEVLVEQGYLRVGTPLLSERLENLEVGVVTSISAAGRSSVDIAKAGHRVKIQVNSAVQVKAGDKLISRFSRKSYELCKKYGKNFFTKNDWDLMSELRKMRNMD